MSSVASGGSSHQSHEPVMSISGHVVTQPSEDNYIDEISDYDLERLRRFPCDNPVIPAMRNERGRLNTFRSWPISTLQVVPAELARSGLYYLGRGDQCRCFYCGGGLQDWHRLDDPWEEHAKWYPTCEYLLHEKGQAYVDSVRQRFPNIQPPNLNLNQNLQPRRQEFVEASAPVERSVNIQSNQIPEEFGSRVPPRYNQIPAENFRTQAANSPNQIRTTNWRSQAVNTNLISHPGSIITQPTPEPSEQSNVPEIRSTMGLHPTEGLLDPPTLHITEPQGPRQPEPPKEPQIPELNIQRPRSPDIPTIRPIRPRSPEPPRIPEILRFPNNTTSTFQTGAGIIIRGPNGTEPATFEPGTNITVEGNSIRISGGGSFSVTRSGVTRVVERGGDTSSIRAVESLPVIRQNLIEMGYSEREIDTAIDRLENRSGNDGISLEGVLDELLLDAGEPERYIPPPAVSATEGENNETSGQPSTTHSGPCVVCLENVKEMVFVPCGHFCTCRSCSRHLSRCPVCRTHIERSVRFFEA